MVSKRTMWIAGTVAVLVGLGAFTVFAVQTAVRNADTAEQQQQTLELQAATPDGRDHGEAAKPENFVHGEFDPQYLEGSGLDSSVPTEAAADYAEQIAEVWMAFDSSAPAADRAAQLSRVIPNGEDWATFPLAIHQFDPRQYGNPTWRTVSAVTGPVEAHQLHGFVIDGVASIPVTIPFVARFTAAGGQDRGSFTSQHVWSFSFDSTGALVEVAEPDLHS